MNGDAADLVPGHPDFERSLAQGQFEFAKARYVRTLTATIVDSLLIAAAAARSQLTHEIADLQSLTRARHHLAVEARRAYAAILPHRVGPNGMQPPAALERFGDSYGADRFYRRAVEAAQAFAEVKELLGKGESRLALMERRLHERLAREEARVQRELGTRRGLRVALLRDPLLGVAYTNLKAVVGEEASEAIALAPPSGAAPLSGQSPD